MSLTAAQRDRACGAVLGGAIGDALGAAYEFGTAPLGSDGPRMLGGGLGGFAPGEWTDDTSMAWCILDIAAQGGDLRSPEALDAIARRFREWYESHPADMGILTRQVLAAGGARPTSAAMITAARVVHERTGRSGGNGSLMRTGPVAPAHLDEPAAVAEAARLIGALTHYDPHAQEGCVLWSLAIRHAIVHGEFDLRSGLAHLDKATARDYWSARIDEAEDHPPSRFVNNGWVVEALQAAWSAIKHTPIPDGPAPCGHLQDALSTAIGVGHDTDTVAAIAGALLGARWGASAIPASWRRISHGYPGLTGERLVEQAHLASNHGNLGPYGWPTAARLDYSSFLVGRPVQVRHPFDDGVLLGDIRCLDDLPAEVTAVVSLCLVGQGHVPTGVEHIVFRLIDQADPRENPNLAYIIDDAARTIATLRDEGKTVLLHCVAAQSRTPTVAIAYAMHRGIPLERARVAVTDALPGANPNAGFAAALSQLRALKTRP